MNTPICDFVRSYAESDSLRLHMPGHKGVNRLGCEAYDITEIVGADSLYEANGIIKESEYNAGQLFGANTFYSAEGSSLSIKAMMYLACLCAESRGERRLVLAGRNAHKAFINSAALLDFDVEWLYPIEGDAYLSCNITAEMLDERLNGMTCKPIAVYLTTPDYLGNVLDLSEISAICKRHNVMLLVDNAHGAYLKFLPESKHPIDLGADMCCDSAHKTLPVLTGGAYLHLSKNMPDFILDKVKGAMSLFGSTSPSYLILLSLDSANEYLDTSFSRELSDCTEKISELKNSLIDFGYSLIGNEPLKITVRTKLYGYYGYEFADILFKKGIVCEYSDPDFVVLMLTPQLSEKLDDIETVLKSIERKELISSVPPELGKPIKKVDIRTACMSRCETVSVDVALNRIQATAAVSCPPAVPIVVSGEQIVETAINAFKYYGINECVVIK